MSQYYVGVKRVFAFPEKKGDQDGYAVIYRRGEPTEYRSWSPKEEFENFYLPLGPGNEDEVTSSMIEAMVDQEGIDQDDDEITACLVTGTVLSCDVADKTETVRETELRLEFVLDWGISGLKPAQE